jgi:proteasome accessory factor C
MIETAAQRLSRVMSMVPYIARRPGVSMIDIAAEYGVDVDQVTADLNLLMVCGLPGYYPDDLIDVVLDEDGGPVSLVYPAGLQRPVKLTGDEAVALTAALRALADLPGLLDAGAVQSALAKLERAGGGAAAAVQIAAGESGPALATVRTAVESGQRLWMRYYTASRDAVSEREVDPIRLLLTEGHTYLEAFCHTAGAVRNFRVDRIDDARVLDEPAQSTLWLETSVPERMYHPGADTAPVTLRLTPGAQWIAEYYLVTSNEPVLENGRPTGDAVVTLPAASDEWLIRLVLSLGGAAVILDRPDLAAQVGERAAEALAGYRSDGDRVSAHRATARDE